MTILGERILQLLKEKHMSRKELSICSGLSCPYISKLTTGKIQHPSYETICKIAQSLNVSTDELTNIQTIYYTIKEKDSKEKEIIKKYRCLPNRAKEKINYLINMEYEDMLKNSK